jgi:uncharacterized membrane protein YozB (DUF420 family)
MSENLRGRDRAFAMTVAALTVGVTLIGFSRSFFLLPFFARPPSWAAKEAIFYAHGAIFAAWFVLLAVQVALIRSGDVRVHRRLGYVGVVLAVFVVTAGTLAGLRAANRPTGFVDVPVPPDQFLAVPLVGMLLFGVLVALAVLWRGDAARHKRLMLLASISILGAPVARIVSMAGVLPPFTDVFVYAALVAVMIAWDLSVHRRPRADTLVGGAAVIGLNALALPFGATSVWLAVARDLMALVPPP